MDTSLISSLWYVGLFVAVLAGLRLVLDRTHILARLARNPRSTIPSKKQSSYKDVLPPQPYDRFLILIRRCPGLIDRSDGLTTKPCVCLPFNSLRERLFIELKLSSEIAKMGTDWWIELENTYKPRLAQRKELYATHGKRVLDYLSPRLWCSTSKRFSRL